MQISSHPFNTSKEYTILVIGGCHITGYGVGAERSFVDLFSRQLKRDGIRHRVHIRPYITLDKPVELAEAIWTVKPDVLLLQLGNHEFSPVSPVRKLNRHFQTKLRKERAKQPLAEGNISFIPVFPSFRPSFLFRLNTLIKHLANLAIFYRYYNREAWTRKVRYAFKTISRFDLEKVIVLEPFPTANTVTNHYRLIGGAIMEEQAVLQGFHYVDHIKRLLTSGGHQNFTVDEMHLNTRSHRVLGKHIASLLKKEVKRSHLKHLTAC